MGHREDLLEGAKRCLLDKGYARTTARDIVAASGTNLASIGYHYGSKEALLNQAFLAVTEEWGDAIGESSGIDHSAYADAFERFEAVWGQVIGSYETSRSLWKLQLEVISRIDDDPELRKAITGPQQEGRKGLAENFQNLDPETDPETTRTAGLVYQALLAGVMMQWLVDPETAPSARDLTDGLRAILENDSPRTTG